jgi:hypothetical protein
MSSQPRPLSLFISYSHRDDAWRAKLETHLAMLKRSGVFRVWHDRKIGAGREWAGEIDNALEQADVILLLVSADFLDSDYCHDRELRRALERHRQGVACVVPVILRACDWHSSALGPLEAIPRDGRPIDGYPGGVDVALTEVSLALRALATQLERDGGSPDDSGRTGVLPPPINTIPSPPETEASEARQPGTQGTTRNIKIGFKLGPLEIGPLEIPWPLQLGRRRVLAGLGCAVLIATMALGVVYMFHIRPALNGARDAMRRGEYDRAVNALSKLSPKLQRWPEIAGLFAQANFGKRLSHEKVPIRTLAPELAVLRTQQPGAANVRLFEGLSAYWIDRDLNRAIEFLADAARRDPEHVYAHTLAAGRLVDRAYDALLRDDWDHARGDLSDASDLLDRLERRVSFAHALPQVAMQRAELLELRGDYKAAYAAYARLSSSDALSAVQAAVTAWRVPELDQRGVESARAALASLKQGVTSSNQSIDWLFRVGPREPVIVRGVDKICLTRLIAEVSQSLSAVRESGALSGGTRVRDASNRPVPGGLGGINSIAPEDCPPEAAPGPIRDIICVHLLGALALTPETDVARRHFFNEWRTARLHCDSRLNAPPILPHHKVTARMAPDGIGRGQGAWT